MGHDLLLDHTGYAGVNHASVIVAHFPIDLIDEINLDHRGGKMIIILISITARSKKSYRIIISPSICYM